MRRLVVEADGGARGNPGPAAYGAVVRDALSGEVLVELADYLGTATNNVAEYQGLLAGLAAAHEIDSDAHVEARLDSRLVVEQLSGGWAIRNPRLRELASKAKALFPAQRVRYTWVPRAQNGRADALVNRALDAVAAGRPARVESWLRGAGDADVYVDAAEHLAAPGAKPSGGPGPGNRIVGWSRADLGTPTTLMVVRHGVTQQSIEHRFSGVNGFDPPLIELGRRQAQAAAEELARRGGADVLVCSPLQRTRQTAAIIADHLGIGEPVVVAGIAEADFGQWDSLTFAEVKARWPDELAAWLASTEVAPPGGESFAAVRRRVDAARAELLERFPRQRVVAISHVTPIKVMVQLMLEAPASSAFRFELAPCSLTTLAWWADGMGTIFGVGESGHLHGVLHETA